MGDHLVCNFKKCRKNLTGNNAWVTSCSHIFCDEDGNREFSKSFSCPACETQLSSKFDILRIDLQTSEQYKSMVLAGQKPEVIMEVATRALSFWTYQTCQERAYQEYTATKAKEKATQIEQYYKQLLERMKTEMNSLKTQASRTRKEYETAMAKCSEISDKLQEKTRQIQKLQSMYDALRRKCITPGMFEKGDFSRKSPEMSKNKQFEIPFSTREALLSSSNIGLLNEQANRTHSNPSIDKDFILRPSPVPLFSLDTEHNFGVPQHHKINFDGTPRTHAQTGDHRITR